MESDKSISISPSLKRVKRSERKSKKIAEISQI